MSLLLKRDFSSNKYRRQFLRTTLRSIFTHAEISSSSALNFEHLAFRSFIKDCLKKSLSSISFDFIFPCKIGNGRSHSLYTAGFCCMGGNGRLAAWLLTNCWRDSSVGKGQKSGSTAVPNLKFKLYLRLNLMCHKSAWRKKIYVLIMYTYI